MRHKVIVVHRQRLCHQILGAQRFVADDSGRIASDGRERWEDGVGRYDGVGQNSGTLADDTAVAENRSGAKVHECVDLGGIHDAVLEK